MGAAGSDASMRVGVLAVQGAVTEHMDALKKAAKQPIEVVAVRHGHELEGLSGIVLPGGESTTISRLLRSGAIQEPLLERARAGTLAVFGTCAGAILLSERATHDVDDKDIQLLGLLDAEVDRNAFGRQKDSFEGAVEVEGVGTVPAVFIRAPVFTKVWGDTQAIATTDRGIVAARKGLILATAFHPELTPDTQLHAHFLDLASQA